MAEEDLLKAVVITVISDRELVESEEVAALLAPRVEMVAESLVLRRASPMSFLLVLPSEEMVDR